MFTNNQLVIMGSVIYLLGGMVASEHSCLFVNIRVIRGGHSFNDTILLMLA
jgi:hypothetical protein